jgi:hypothetical protein
MSGTSRDGSHAKQEMIVRREAMKTIVSALVALSVLAGIAAAPASAFDAKKFWQDHATSGLR